MDVNFGKRHFFLVDLNMNGDRIKRIKQKKSLSFPILMV